MSLEAIARKMEIKEYARELLFGTTLDAKLLDVAELTDNEPGTAVSVPDFPGRPPQLRRGAVHSRPDKPLSDLRKLESETDRALLLHHFANHELLALELMALVLLRFPDAPETFRRGLTGTIREEQKHLRLYRKRMNVLGMDFGDAPVNAFFWSHIAHVRSPLDFVVRMSMTFEQANLDYAQHYARAFAELGDAKTAAVLELVLKEEIGHVKNGVHWFHEWREPDGGDPKTASPSPGDWDAYRALLPDNLTPARARGIGFNARAREQAGLSPEFIRELKVYSHSRGRPPAVYAFHPACEEYIARGADAKLNANITRLAGDLETLPMFCAAGEDVVLVRKRPSSEFLHAMGACGMPVPEFVMANVLEYRKASKSDHGEAPVEFAKLSARKLGDIRPWGWSPLAWRTFRPLMDRVVGKTGRTLREQPGPDAYPEHLRRVFSREFGRSVALKFTAETGLGNRDDAGVLVESEQELRTALADFAEREQIALAKSLFSSSGRDKYRLDPDVSADGLPESTANRLKKLIREQGGLLLEPFRARRLDLSAQFQVEVSGRVRVLGLTRMLTDEHGRWLGAVIGNLMDDLSPEEKNFTRNAMGEIRRAAAFAGRELLEAGYHGPAGIDAFVHEGPNGEARLRPMVEINPRFTMGRIALGIAARVRSGRTGIWFLLNRKDLEGAGYEDFESCARDLKRRFPLQLENNPAPFLMSGALPTTDPSQAEDLLSVLLIAPDIRAARTALEPLERITAAI